METRRALLIYISGIFERENVVNYSFQLITKKECNTLLNQS